MNINIGQWQSRDWPALLKDMVRWCKETCPAGWQCDERLDNWKFKNESDGLMFILKFKNDN